MDFVNLNQPTSGNYINIHIYAYYIYIRFLQCRLVSLHIKCFLGMFCYLCLCDCDIMLPKLGVPKPVIRTFCRMTRCGKV